VSLRRRERAARSDAGEPIADRSVVLFITALGLAVAFAPGHVPALTIPG
jgi:hypothetical protein